MNYELSGKRLAIVIIVLISLPSLAWLVFGRERDASLPSLKNPRLVVKKSRRELQVFDNGKLVKTYKIVLGLNPQGDKLIEGDNKTPEGEFYVAVKNPNSNFHRSLGLSYPNAEAAARGLRDKLISKSEHDEIVRAIRENRLPPQYTALGGEIYIHGGGTASDWTAGCVALENEQIQELFDAIPPGTSVSIIK